MQGTGWLPEDFATDDIGVWPENWPAFTLFADMQTQWRISMGGPTGLDYPALFALMDLHGVAPDDKRQLFADVQVLEASALAQMNKKQ